MFRASPEFQKRLDKYQTIDPIEAAAIKHERRRMKIIRGISGALSLLTFAGVQVAEYSADVRSNQEVQANSIITIEDHGNPLDPVNNDKAIVSIDGTGTVDATALNSYIAPNVQHIQDGRIWGVGYNDAPLKYENIADKLIAKANKEGVTSLTFIGQSSGGDIAMEVEERIREKSNIDIAATFLMFTPNGVASLRSEQQSLTEFAKTFAKFPGAIYSTPIRFMGEMGLRADNYTHGSITDNISDFVTTANRVGDAIAEKKLPGTWLVIDQLLQIENADLKTRIENLGKTAPDVIRSPIFYLGTENDLVVNDAKSAQEIRDYAHAAHVPFFYYNVPDAVHAQPGINNNAYVKVFADARSQMKEVILSQQQRAAMHKYTANAVPGTPQ
jgi:hypothetical protein